MVAGSRPLRDDGSLSAAAPIADGQYEVVLDLNVNAQSGDTSVFLVELAYGGLFTLENIPQDSLQPLLLIECPRLLFPFARRVVADATREIAAWRPNTARRGLTADRPDA